MHVPHQLNYQAWQVDIVTEFSFITRLCCHVCSFCVLVETCLSHCCCCWDRMFLLRPTRSLVWVCSCSSRGQTTRVHYFIRYKYADRRRALCINKLYTQTEIQVHFDQQSAAWFSAVFQSYACKTYQKQQPWDRGT